MLQTWKKLGFNSIKITKPVPNPIECFSNTRFTGQVEEPHPTIRIENNIMGIDKHWWHYKKDH